MDYFEINKERLVLKPLGKQYLNSICDGLRKYKIYVSFA